MKILSYVVYIIGFIITIGWIHGIRVYTKSGEDLNKGTVNITMLFIFSLILVPLFGISPFHLLWLFPISAFVGFLSISFPFSLLWYLSRYVWRIACIGIDLEEAPKKHGIITRTRELMIKENISAEEALKRFMK